MKCPKCHSDNPLEALFCMKCGNRLVAKDTPAEAPREDAVPESERRQLTVMFCDLVGSTPLSEQLDPEELREIVRAYQQTCAEVVQRFDGHIAQLLGDALLVYFGWPQAHEDDAQRGVKTGLGMLEAMAVLNDRLEKDKGIQLEIRVGIHTGLVVVGEMGGGDHKEQLALGEAPNIASRLQGLAEPDTVVLSAATFQLVQGFFTVENLGLRMLKGIPASVQVYRVLRESDAQSRLDVAMTRGLTPLVGREQEIELLLEKWARVKDGLGQVFLLSGEAGVGKSRLVQVLKNHVTVEPYSLLECRSSPYYQNTSLYAITDLFHRMLQSHPDDTPEERLARLERTLSPYRLPLKETVPLFAPLVSLPISEDRYPPLHLTAQQQRQKTFEALIAILLELAEQQPVLFILEDLHWADPTTLDFFDLLIDRIQTASIYILLTYRLDFQPTWDLCSHLTHVRLDRLSRGQIERMVSRVAGGKNLPEQLVQQIVEKTDGVPLFVEELTKAVLGSDNLHEVDDHYELTGTLPSLAIPATLQDSLMARLDKLVTAKTIAQCAAVIGRQFSYDLLQAVSHLDEITLLSELERLVDAELVYKRGTPPQTTYMFKHALVQDAAYQSLLKRTRRQYHQQIAQVLEERLPETASYQPELLAHHYTEAGLMQQAAGYWHKAGENACEISAYVEAIAHLRKGLDVVQSFTDPSERSRHELSLQFTLAESLTGTMGDTAAEVVQAYNRARELCRQVEEPAKLFSILVKLRRYYTQTGDMVSARELGEQLLTMAQQQKDVALLLEAHWSLGQLLYSLGEIVPARWQLQQGMALYVPQLLDTQSRRNAAGTQIACLIHVAFILWAQGYPDQACTHAHDALSLAHELSHPFTLAFALFGTAVVHIYRREVQAVQEKAESVLAMAREQGFKPFVARGTLLQAWTLAEQGQAEDGIALFHRVHASQRDAINELVWLAFVPLILSAFGTTGHSEEGLSIAHETQAQMDKTGIRFSTAELHRLRGELLLIPKCGVRYPELTPEACFRKALDVARHQEAKSWELRAATSLARLWQYQDKCRDAYNLLAPIYNWFTEGLDTADLKDAKKLLDELS